MKKATLCLALATVLGFGFLGRGTPQAQALNAFRVEFIAKYVKADSEDVKDKAFAAAVEKAKCGICHEGKNKKNRNAYGKALDELLDFKADAENKEKIQAALKKVESKRSDPKNEKSPTFGDLIKAGELPASPKKS